MINYFSYDKIFCYKKSCVIFFIIANKIDAFPDFLLNDVVILYAFFLLLSTFYRLIYLLGEKNVVKRGISTYIFRNSPVV